METPSPIQKVTKRMEKTTMINKIKIRLIAIYMLLFGVTALIYVAFPIPTIAFAIYNLYCGDFMLALIVSLFSLLSYMTSDWYLDLFMDQHFAMKEKIESLRK